MQPVLAIVGAGDLGGALAHAAAARDRFAQIRLIDEQSSVAAGKALDILQAAPIEGFSTRIVASGDTRDAAGARVIVFADAAGRPAAEWQGDAALSVIANLARLGGEPTFVCAGSSQRALIALAVKEARVPRGAIVGSAPLALAAAVRAVAALEARGSAADVALSVLGVPPADIVVPWSQVTIAGYAAERVLDPPQIARLNARVPRLWPPGPYALASAAAAVCEAIVTGAHRVYSCFAVLEDGSGRVAAVPVSFARGRVAVMTPELSVQERVLLDNALARV
jgi:malate dehydrogenase